MIPGNRPSLAGSRERTGMLERGAGLLKQRDPLCPPKTCPAKRDGHCLKGSPLAAFPLVLPRFRGYPALRAAPGTAQTFSLLKPSADNPPEEKSAIRANLKAEEGEEGCE